MTWDAQQIARALAVQVFHRKAVVMVPNCYWAGDEADLLVVRTDLRLVDVEVKVSRSDLKADAKKDKWVDVADYTWTPGTEYLAWKDRPRAQRQWPRRIWKHYYALPRDIWTESLTESIPPASGVILMNRHNDGRVGAYAHRQAKPCPAAEKIGLDEVIDVARVCSVRYWDRYVRLRESQPVSAPALTSPQEQKP